MSAKNESAHATPFTVTIEAREGVTTGISVHDQAHTMRVAVDPAKGAEDIVTPGHVHPLKAKRRRRPGAHGAHRGRRRPGAAGRAARRPA